MSFLKFGAEGEIIPNPSALITTNADVDHRGVEQFNHTEYSQFSVTPQPTLWLHGVARFPAEVAAFATITDGDKFFAIKDAASNTLISMYSRNMGNNNYNHLYIRGITDDTNTLTDMAVFGAIPHGVDMIMDLHATLTGTTLTIEAYINGSLIAARTIVGVTPVWGQPAIGTYGWFYDNVISFTQWHNVGISDTPTLGLGLVSMEATAAGFHTTGVGDYTDVSEEGVDLSTSISLPNIGDKESWTVNLLTGKTTSSAIKGIVFSSTMILETGGPVTGYRYFVRSGGTDFLTGGGTHIPSDVMGNITEEVSINPVTGNPFTAAEVTAGIEIGIEAV